MRQTRRSPLVQIVSGMAPLADDFTEYHDCRPIFINAINVVRKMCG